MNYGRHARDLMLELKRSIGSDGDAHLTTTVPVPPYNDELVQAALHDLNLHCEALEDQIKAATTAATETEQQPSNSPAPPLPLSVRPSAFLQDCAIRRNKRCLLAYHWIRMQRIQEQLYWNSSTMNAHDENGSEMVDRHDDDDDDDNDANMLLSALSPAEKDFFQNYTALQSWYGTTLPLCIVDLRACSGSPPLATTDSVQVRVVRALTTTFTSTSDMNDNNAVTQQTPDGHIVLESGQTINMSAVGLTYYLPWTDVEQFIRSGHLQILRAGELGVGGVEDET